MKKAIKIVNFFLPVVIYIVCSLLAFLCWRIFNQGAAPVISLNIALVLILQLHFQATFLIFRPVFLSTHLNTLFI